MKFKTALVSLATVAVLAGVTGCGSSDDSGSTPQKATSSSAPKESSSPQPSSDGSDDASTSAKMTIKDFKYQVPKSVAPGAKITVTNKDSAAHTVTADGKGDFDLKVAPGATETFTAPKTPGTYKIKCTYHANMSGKLVVK